MSGRDRRQRAIGHARGVELDPSWNIGDNPNGGYLVSLALQDLLGRSAHPDPLSVTAHFLRPGLAGAAYEVDSGIVRSGRTTTFGTAGLRQDGRDRVRVVAVLGDLGAVGAPGGGRSMATSVPSIPPPDDCPARSGGEQGVELPILDRLDIRIHPDQAQAGQAGDAVVSGWIRRREVVAPDPASMVIFADAFPPSVFGRFGAVGWVPTIELTVHVLRRPAPGWILGRFVTTDLQDDRLIEDGTLWDASGAVVARSRQLGLLRA
jgi:acyl-CoA thioesterase